MPIADMVGSRLGIALALGLQAGVLGTFVGTSHGRYCRPEAPPPSWDRLTARWSLGRMGVSLPSFVFALFLSYFLGYKLQLFRLLYSQNMPVSSTVMPTIALSMFTIASVARYTRSEMVNVMASDYMMLAQSKGLPKAKLVARHALRNTLVSVITVLVPLLVNLMTGSLVIEKIFSIPGLGSLYIQAIQSNDYNVVLAISFIYSVIFIVAMLLVDLLYGVIDPRIRVAAKGEA